MERKLRTKIMQQLNSGFSARQIFDTIAGFLNQPSDDIERIVNNCHWDKKRIMINFDYFPESDGIYYHKTFDELD